jgi:hypothetical protein
MKIRALLAGSCRTVAIALTGFFILAASPHAVHAVAETVTHSHGIEITLSLSSTEIHVGEPVALRITMQNQTLAQKVELSSRFFLPEGNDIEVMVQPEGELPSRYSGAVDITTYAALPVELSASQPLRREVTLLYDRTAESGYLFGKPGKYTITASFSCKIKGQEEELKATLRPATITVSPLDGDGAAAFAMIDNPEAAKALHLGKIDNDDLLKTFKSLVEKYPATVHGRLAMKAIGIHETYAPKPDRADAAKMLLRYLKEEPNPYEPDYVVYALIVDNHFQEKWDVARQWTYYLHDKYPGSILFRMQDPLARYYYFAPQEYANTFPWYMLTNTESVPGAPPPTDLKPITK